MPYFDCEGDRIHYRVEGDGFPVMLLHSLGGSTRMWETTFAALSPYFKVVSFDGRGHGETTYNTRFSMARYGADAMALADELKLDRLHLLGLSMGARTVVRLAATRPERVVGLVVADTAPGDSAEPAPRVAALLKRIREVGDEVYAREYTRSRLMPSTSKQVEDAFAASVLKTMPDVYVDTFTSILHDDTRGILGDVRAETLVVVGENDVSSPPKVAHGFVDGIKGAQFEVIPNANHLSNLDQPERFNEIVVKFLRSVDVPR